MAEERDQEELIGTVIHYFARPEVGAIQLDAELRVGDIIRFEGATTGFEQEVASMQIEHETVEAAPAGADVGIKVTSRVRRGDRVYRVSG